MRISDGSSDVCSSDLRSPTRSSAMSRQLWRRLDGRDRFHGWPRIKRRWEPTSASMLAGMSVSRIPRRLAAAATIQVGAGRLREDRSKTPHATRQAVSAQGSALKVTKQNRKNAEQG